MLNQPAPVQTRRGRTPGSRNKNSLEFINLYETLKAKYACPVEALFKIIAMKRIDRNIQISAARTLLPYRFSRIKPLDDDEGIQGELTLVWDSDKIPDDIETEAKAPE